jgi:4-nitrophenyl phosphatase
MDGVLWRADQPIGDLPKIFDQINHRGLQVVFATNNATQTPSRYVQKLAGFGVSAREEQIFTSARATAAYLKEIYPDGGPVFVVGEEGLVTSLQDAGFTNNMKSSPLAVVVGLDREINYKKLSAATLFVRGGAQLIGTNPDRTLPTPQGLEPGAGALVAAIEAAAGRQATIIGKPQPIIFNLALKGLAGSPGETLIVGDRLETDIAGGQAAGCLTALVLSGVTDRETAQAWQPAIDYIAEDLASLVERL